MQFAGSRFSTRDITASRASAVVCLFVVKVSITTAFVIVLDESKKSLHV